MKNAKNLKDHRMKKIFYLTFSLLLAGLLNSCGDSSELEKKRAQLEEYKNEMTGLRTKIKELEMEIAMLDTTKEESNSILVSLFSMKKEPFIHEIEVRGSVESRKNILISAETMGRVEAIQVREGQEVEKGQLLMKLDADILENNLAELRTQLELAKTVFERQENLWNQKIGTEIQYLEAKNNYESLQRRISTINSQLSQAYVRAPFSGVVDDVPIRVGEMAQMGMPLVRIVNQKDMYIKAEVSEAYLGKLKKGAPVKAFFRAQDTTLITTITSVSKVINEANRTFVVEMSLPDNSALGFQPNQVVVLTMRDYQNETAYSVPSKIIQNDDEGKFVYVVKDREGKLITEKLHVDVGLTFDGTTEILSGLTGTEQIVEKGYRDVSAGSEVSIVD